jgi:hypothetical protein
MPDGYVEARRVMELRTEKKKSEKNHRRKKKNK